MDSDPKYIGKGVVLILTAVILIFLMVYFINNKPGTRTQTAASETSATSADSTGVKTAYGVQIGDNLKGFLRDADFFDIDMNNSNLSLNAETGTVSQTSGTMSSTGELRNQAISFYVQAGEGKILVTFVDEASCVITGQRISIALSRKSEMYTAELTYIDEDKDGVIEVRGLSPGIWEMRLNTLLGYQIPTDVFEIALDVDPDEADALATDETDTDQDESDVNDSDAGANNITETDDETDGTDDDNAANEASSN